MHEFSMQPRRTVFGSQHCSKYSDSKCLSYIGLDRITHSNINVHCRQSSTERTTNFLPAGSAFCKRSPFPTTLLSAKLGFLHSAQISQPRGPKAITCSTRSWATSNS